jgi:hypothetical protein
MKTGKIFLSIYVVIYKISFIPAIFFFMKKKYISVLNRLTKKRKDDIQLCHRFFFVSSTFPTIDRCNSFRE